MSSSFTIIASVFIWGQNQLSFSVSFIIGMNFGSFNGFLTLAFTLLLSDIVGYFISP